MPATPAPVSATQTTQLTDQTTQQQAAPAARRPFEAFAGIEETFTNNVNLQPNDVRRSDWVTQLTPGFNVALVGAHSSLTGSVSVPILLYARTGGENNKVEPQVSLLGNAELIEHLLYVDGLIAVNQQYLTPFGQRSGSLANSTDNRYTAQEYRLSPYVRGSAGSDYSYELRDNNIWSNGNNTVVNGSYTNELVGFFRRDPRPLGWAVEIDRTSTKFQDQSRQLQELARLRGLYQADPQMLLSASAGYEYNDLLIETKEDVIYGVGVRWRPSERTNLDASWEHRYFGSSYNVVFDHRTPLSVWSLVASRNVTSYPQQLGALPGGIDVAAALNQLFLSRVTDPVARQNIVSQLIQDRGLPPFLSDPVTIYTQQLQLQETLIGTIGLLGARNSVFGSIYRQRVEPVSGSGNVLPPELESLQNNTQVGGNLVWTHSLTPQVALSGSIDGSRTTDNAGPGVTRQGTVRLGVTTPLSLLTTIYAGLRYQISRSNVNFDYNEAAAFVGLYHRFQ
jgi:uncharacterized protein (PEP-CTERM system associated)